MFALFDGGLGKCDYVFVCSPPPLFEIRFYFTGYASLTFTVILLPQFRKQRESQLAR